MVVIKGEITKIISYRNPKLIKVKNQEDDKNYTIEYNEYLPVKEKDILYCNATKEEGIYLPTCKPLVVIPYTEEHIFACFYKAFKKTKVKNIEEIYQELLNKTEEKTAESLVYYLDSLVCENKKKKYNSISVQNLNKLLEWWSKEHLFRRLYLFGLTKSEIKKSYFEPSKVYTKLVKNPFEICSISLTKAANIYRMYGKLPTEEQYNCGQIIRYVEKLLSFGSLACHVSKIEKEFVLFDKYKEKLIKKYNLIIVGDLLYTIKTKQIEDFVSWEIASRINENKKEQDRIQKINKDGTNIECNHRIYPEPNLVLTAEQEKALFGVLNNHISIITGGAGCGKTTIIKQIVKNLSDKGEIFMLTSLTGKAVLRMREVVGLDEKVSQTMHRMIHNSANIKKFFYLIVDETSMIPTELFYQLLVEFNHYFKIVFVGDDNQLPPIGKGTLFKDLIESEQIPIFNLSTNKRFANNNILINSNSIVQKIKENKEVKFQNGNGFFLLEGDIEKCKQIVKNLRQNNIDEKKITVLTPVKRYIETMVEFQRHHFLTSKKFVFKDMSFMVGDRVMQNKNAYLNNSYDIMNGEEGYVTNITSEHVVVDYGEEKVLKYSYIESILEGIDNEKMEEINEGQLSIRDIKLSFAKTIHCSQGSEYDYVILFVPEGIDNFMTINLLYTGITRAKKTLWLVGKAKTIWRCTNNFIKKSPSLMAEEIKKKLL